jgi:ribosomal protein L29
MKKKEVKKLTKDQAMKNIEKLKKDLFNFRFQKINGQLKNPAKISETKKTIARLKTITERKINA